MIDTVIIMLMFIESKITSIVLMAALWSISYVKIEQNRIYSSYMRLYVYLSAFANASKVFITERACVLVLNEILKHLHFSTFESDHAWLLA